MYYYYYRCELWTPQVEIGMKFQKNREKWYVPEQNGAIHANMTLESCLFELFFVVSSKYMVASFVFWLTISKEYFTQNFSADFLPWTTFYFLFNTMHSYRYMIYISSGSRFAMPEAKHLSGVLSDGKFSRPGATASVYIRLIRYWFIDLCAHTHSHIHILSQYVQIV